MRVFITGATGVIGRRVVPLLVKAGHQVTAVGRSPHRSATLRQQGAAVVDVGLFDPAALRDVVRGHDAVVNLATHMPSSATAMLLPWAWKENARLRRDASAALVDAALAAGVGRLVQESFAPVYEDGGDRWIDERWPLRPAPYNRTVLDAERSAERFGASGGAGVVLRFGAFYGGDSRVLHEMVRMVARGWAPLRRPCTLLFHPTSRAARAYRPRASARLSRFHGQREECAPAHQTRSRLLPAPAIFTRHGHHPQDAAARDHSR